MKRIPLRAAVIALAAALLAAVPARAGVVKWTYTATASQSQVASTDGKSHLNLFNEPTVAGDPPVAAEGSTDVPVTNITTASSVDGDHQSTFNAPYSVKFTITDTASGLSNSLTFTGVFGGTLSLDNAGVTFGFTGLTTQQLTLGDNVYTVTGGNYVPPGNPSDLNKGTIALSVNVTPANSVPEPGSLALACVGLGCGAAFWRRRARAVA